MNRFTFPIFCTLAIALTVAGTLVHGRLINRWGGSTAEIDAAAASLRLAPEQFGDWRLVDEEEFSERIQRITSYANAWRRTYVNTRTGQKVNAAMLVGPPGPTTSHVAEMCYNTRGFSQVGDRETFTLQFPGTGVNEFAEDRFISPDVAARRLQVCYSWRQDEGWRVPELPRIAFGAGAYLYKIQVAAYYTTDLSDDAEESICRNFLMEFGPALDETVFRERIER